MVKKIFNLSREMEILSKSSFYYSPLGLHCNASE